VNGWPGVTFGQIIPSAPLGELWDDISRFWTDTEGAADEKGGTDEACGTDEEDATDENRPTARDIFFLGSVDISLNTEGKLDEIRSGRLNTIVPEDHPIMQQVSQRRSLPPCKTKRREKAGRDGKSVSLGWIWHEFDKLATSQKLRRAYQVSDAVLDEVERFLERLNGTIPIPESPYVWYLGQYRVKMKATRFKNTVRRARDEVLLREDKRHPAGSSLEGGPDPPARTSDDQ
jgi:hypothetical protein